MTIGPDFFNADNYHDVDTAMKVTSTTKLKMSMTSMMKEGDEKMNGEANDYVVLVDVANGTLTMSR